MSHTGHLTRMEDRLIKITGLKGDFGSDPKGYPPRTIDELYKEGEIINQSPYSLFSSIGYSPKRRRTSLSCYLQDADRR